MTRSRVDPTAEFFAALARRGHEPLLARVNGALRIVLQDGRRKSRWRVEIENGDVRVSRGSGTAACTLRTEKALFDRFVTGDANAMAALLRGAVEFNGDTELLVLFQRLLRASGYSSDRHRTASHEERMP